jgi:hypothetical protein
MQPFVLISKIRPGAMIPEHLLYLNINYIAIDVLLDWVSGLQGEQR